MMQKAGYRITMVCRSSFEEVRDSGIYVDTKWGSASFKPSSVLNSLDGFSETVDYTVIATKVLTIEDINQLFLNYAPVSPIVLIQNGLFIEELYMQRFPHLDIISGLAFVCVFRESFTNVRHIDYGRLDLGIFPSGQLVACNELAESLQSVGVDARVSECIQKQRWENWYGMHRLIRYRLFMKPILLNYLIGIS